MNPGEQIHKSMQRICDDDLAKQAKEQPPDGGNRKGVGKVKMNLVMHDMAEALYEVARVMTFGAVKHEPKGWIKVPNGIYEYTEALHRHLNAESRGELRDKEWDLLHAAHAACCALIRTQLILNNLKVPEGCLQEGRLPPGTTITIKRPIGGSAEQAAPLSDFTPIPGDTTGLCGACKAIIRGAKVTYLAYDKNNLVGDVDGVMVICEACAKFSSDLSVLGVNTPERLGQAREAIKFASGRK